ncbi:MULTISPECIES: hypothetical protein [unclassified Ruegeria]|uniref:hypothetical protein n=1 Tax=unclassified Ruegeria TaxID=2625375 RepID=UPI001489ADEC|nr:MULTISPECIES: hypothetical protein [unclassified Ruegeria]NOD61693.1 hypothetical protein [Ruegeria sp. HKCCD6109]
MPSGWECRACAGTAHAAIAAKEATPWMIGIASGESLDGRTTVEFGLLLCNVSHSNEAVGCSQAGAWRFA